MILLEVTEGLLQLQSFVQGLHFIDVCTIGNVRIKLILIISHVVRFATRGKFLQLTDENKDKKSCVSFIIPNTNCNA